MPALPEPRVASGKWCEAAVGGEGAWHVPPAGGGAPCMSQAGAATEGWGPPSLPARTLPTTAVCYCPVYSLHVCAQHCDLALAGARIVFHRGSTARGPRRTVAQAGSKEVKQGDRACIGSSPQGMGEKNGMGAKMVAKARQGGQCQLSKDALVQHWHLTASCMHGHCEHISQRANFSLSWARLSKRGC